MADDDRRMDLGDSVQPEALAAQEISTHSAQPEGIQLLGKSLQPDVLRPGLDPDGVGASAQPEAVPLTTQQASPPPPADED